MKILGILHRQALLIMHRRNRSAVISRAPGDIRSRYNQTRVPLFCREDGGALVEFALVMPMFLTLITGMFAFGLTMNNYVELTNAVSIGARAFADGAGVTAGATDQCAFAITTVKAAAPNLNSGNMNVTVSINGGAAQTTCSGVTLTPTNPATVTATYPCTFLIFSGKMSCNLAASTTELIQ